MKSLLFIFNPCAGKGQVKTSLSDIIDVFVKAGYKVDVHPTQRKDDAKKYLIKYGELYDRVVCCGGDGTLNEVMTGLMKQMKRPTLGYIPAGSTNDFAVGLKLPKNNMIRSAKIAVKGTPYPVDMGTFNKKMFIYVAAFGAFTEVSYKTSQDKKNLLGRSAYIIEALKSVPSIKEHHMAFKCDENIIEGDFIYGMVTNAVSVGGIRGITGSKICLNDGLFEVTLIKKPKNPLELEDIISVLLMGKKSKSDCVIELKANIVQVKNPKKTPWTLDGEYGSSEEKIVIKNHRKVINIMSSYKGRLL